MTEINYKQEGQGPPLLLLHGFPETLECWDDVVYLLQCHFTIIRADLPGYGNSPLLKDSSKKTMAKAIHELMSGLGYKRFAVAGHDRGGLVGARLALDFPGAVSSLVILDVIPTIDLWEAMDAGTAMGAYHMVFLAQENGVPEALLGGCPNVFVDSFLEGWSTFGKPLSGQKKQLYHEAFNPSGVCADYRAGASQDLKHDANDRESGRKIVCPVSVLWQEPGGEAPPFDPIKIWSRWANETRGRGVNCGHFLPEEQPEEVASAIAEHVTGNLLSFR